MGWIDITQPLTNAIGTWPDDTPFRYEVVASKSQTGSVNVGKMITSMHTGTHADAPFHFDDAGETIEQLDINIFIGEALVIDVSGIEIIQPKHLHMLENRPTERVLLKTKHTVDVEQFPERIPVIDPTSAAYLKKNGVKLLGVDVPSVDPLISKKVAAHHALYQHNIQIVENLLLENITQGLYDFIALPLKVVGADGAPVRAVIKPK